MSITREQIVDQNLLQFLRSTPGASLPQNLDLPVREGSRLSGRQAIDLLDSQFVARHLDLIARELKAEGKAFYTIGSAGHEGNAAAAMALRPADMGFLHYRSGAFMAQLSKAVPGEPQMYNVLLSLMAGSADPVSGGRHKVFGSVSCNIPPQTSTIASHLSKAAGAAFALERMKQAGLRHALCDDSIVYCTFGDGSLNHAVAQTAFNAVQLWSHRKLPAPILFICEDNGIGISVPTPEGWVAASMSNRPWLRYFSCDGLDIVDTYETARAAVEYVRRERAPAFLHMSVVRMLGHAGTDVELMYHTREEIEAVEAKDPLIATARLLLQGGFLTPAEASAMYEDVRLRVHALAKEALRKPKLSGVEEVMRPLAPYSREQVMSEARSDGFLHAGDVAGGKPAESNKPRHFAAVYNQGLRDILLKYPESFLFGEDVGKKGGVYHVTADLQKAFGGLRVFDTQLDETTILGLAQGFGHVGALPLPEIQYLAYYHNAEDQIRGEAASLQYFSNGQFRNPMVIRVASWAYQKGFGGHFHNDNSIAALRDIPGIVIATPCRGDDAVKMLRTCMALAKVDGRVVFFLEPIALYMTRDLHEANDGLWQTTYPPFQETIELGEGGVYDEAAGDLTILTFANGCYLSLKAAKLLREKHNVKARVVDLRWLAPLNVDFIVQQAQATGHVLVVDEGRATGGVGEEIVAHLAQRAPDVRVRRLAGADCYIPLGDAAHCVLPSVQSIVEEAKRCLDREQASAGKPLYPMGGKKRVGGRES